jgi:hypothetical protein
MVVFADLHDLKNIYAESLPTLPIYTKFSTKFSTTVETKFTKFSTKFSTTLETKFSTINSNLPTLSVLEC